MIDGHRLIESDKSTIGPEIDRYKIASRLGTGWIRVSRSIRSSRVNVPINFYLGNLALTTRNESLKRVQALSKMRHPNIVTLVDFGTTQTDNFL